MHQNRLSKLYTIFSIYSSEYDGLFSTSFVNGRVCSFVKSKIVIFLLSYFLLLIIYVLGYQRGFPWFVPRWKHYRNQTITTNINMYKNIMHQNMNSKLYTIFSIDSSEYLLIIFVDQTETVPDHHSQS